MIQSIVVKVSGEAKNKKSTAEILIAHQEKRSKSILRSRKSALAYLRKIGAVDKNGKSKVTPL